MRTYVLLLVLSFSSAIQAQSLQESGFDTSSWIVIEPSVFDLGLLVVKPTKRVEFDELVFLSNEAITVKKLSEDSDSLKYSVVGYSEAGVPMSFDTDALQIYQDGRKLDYSVLPFDSSGKKATFTFLLDRSGSMAGEPIKDLISVLERFLGAINTDQFLCRIGWYSDQYYFEGDAGILSNCNADHFRTIDNPGADGGTAVMGALQSAIDYYNDSTVGDFQRNIIIISDGQDGSYSFDLKNKGDIQIYVYIIGEYPQHNLLDVGDFFFSKDVSFQDYLPAYLGNIEKQILYQELIEIDAKELK